MRLKQEEVTNLLQNMNKRVPSSIIENIDTSKLKRCLHIDITPGPYAVGRIKDKDKISSNRHKITLLVVLGTCNNSNIIYFNIRDFGSSKYYCVLKLTLDKEELVELKKLEGSKLKSNKENMYINKSSFKPFFTKYLSSLYLRDHGINSFGLSLSYNKRGRELDIVNPLYSLKSFMAGRYETAGFELIEDTTGKKKVNIVEKDRDDKLIAIFEFETKYKDIVFVTEGSADAMNVALDFKCTAIASLGKGNLLKVVTELSVKFKDVFVVFDSDVDTTLKTDIIDIKNVYEYHIFDYSRYKDYSEFKLKGPGSKPRALHHNFGKSLKSQA